jgi:Cdc6-like AAA superfamily ATPase
VVYEIIKKIDPYFQASIEDCHSAELQYILADILQERKEALILIFDNIESLVEKEPEEVNSLFYGFQRFSEGKNEEPNLFSQILVAQDLAFLSELDRSVFRKVVTDVIHFEPYTAEETAGILQEYIRKKWQLSKIFEENIWFISLISRGNIHRGQELVDKAFLLAQRNSDKRVLPEHVRIINQQITDFHIPITKLDNLLLGDKLLLLSIARRFKTSPKAFLDVLDIPGLFFSICEEFKQLQCARLFSDYLKNLEKLAIIDKHTIDKEIVLTLSDIAAQELVRALEERMKKRTKGDKFYL